MSQVINPDMFSLNMAPVKDKRELVQVNGTDVLSCFPSASETPPEGCDGWKFIITNLLESSPDIQVYVNQVINTRILHGDVMVHPKCIIEVV